MRALSYVPVTAVPPTVGAHPGATGMPGKAIAPRCAPTQGVRQPMDGAHDWWCDAGARRDCTVDRASLSGSIPTATGSVGAHLGATALPVMPVAPWCAPTSHWDCRDGISRARGRQRSEHRVTDGQPQSDPRPVRRPPGVVHVTGNPDNAQKPAGHAHTGHLVRLFPCQGFTRRCNAPRWSRAPGGSASREPVPSRGPDGRSKTQEFTRHGSVSCRARCPVGR
ncbi:hypothetical protein FHR58_000950 [Xanthomonas arboricola]|nr:hypothetical protein [Xanthomonas arboricola]